MIASLVTKKIPASIIESEHKKIFFDIKIRKIDCF
jgi:hypothetical protein